jgi:hypothetical protein
MVNGVEGKLKPVGHAKFVEDVVQVILDRLLADQHLLGHLPVLEALGDEVDDFALAPAERGARDRGRRLLWRRRGFLVGHEPADDGGGGAGIVPGWAVHAARYSTWTVNNQGRRAAPGPPNQRDLEEIER